MAASCNKVGSRNGHFVIKGRVLQDCSAAPLAGAPIRVHFETEWSSDGDYFSGEIGSGTTDAEGRFEIKCKSYKGDGSLSVSTRNVCMGRNGALPRSETIDLGTAYQHTTFGAHLRIRMDVAYRPSDTLFFSFDPAEGAQTIYPIAPEQIVHFETRSISGGGYLGTGGDEVTPTLRWAIGKRDYEAVIGDGTLTHPISPFWRNVRLRRCSMMDTVDVRAGSW